MEKRGRRPSKKPATADETSHPIRWLHISDLHFKEEEKWDRRATLRALIAKARELKESGLAPDLVFVTGDIAWSGKAKEYEQASRFFRDLNEALGLDPKDRWFLVPGNHDVDRGRIKQPHRLIQEGLEDEPIVEETLRDPDTMRLLSTRLEAYYAFTGDFLGAARAWQPDRPWRTDVRHLHGVSIGILQLNSAWIAEGGKRDDANLLVGEAQLHEALDGTPDVLFRIALMHHPLSNLRVFDARRIKSILGAPGGAFFLLRGHLHENQMNLQESPDGTSCELAAGTLYTEENRQPRGFHVGEIDLVKGEARIHLFRFSEDGRGFFAPDNLTYENARNGTWRIKLPSALSLGGRKSKGRATITPSQRLTFAARYQQAAANYHGHARFIGFPSQSTRPNARVSDLFVPLKMARREPGAESHSVTTAEIAQRLLGKEKKTPARLVALGDPGSGKTTLTRFLVMLASGAISLPGVKAENARLPIRVAFRDFVERRRENRNFSLLDYLDWQAQAELSLTLPKNFLSNAMKRGEAVLLLDGLDEVGSPEQRAAIRDLVSSFAAAHPRLPMLVTSRIAGYDEAPLSKATEQDAVLIACEELVLEKFDDEALREFVTRWYAVQETADPAARERGVTDLLAALDADERVKELARTPVLATLIAMIHRVEANLPGERAKLDDLCVRLLLETWPAQAKRGGFTELDPGLQRAYLESLALGIQTDRERNDEKGVTFGRDDLIARLMPILAKRDFAGQSPEKLKGLVERWIEHLEKQSGILVEQSAGVYAFFHLSILEYLAARGMEREWGRDGALEAIGRRSLDPVWREVCLLAVGSHADDDDFLDAVFEKVSAAVDHRRWDFLVRCLREEARFRPDQRDRILAAYAAAVLENGYWFTDASLIDEIVRFSIRHGDAVQAWIDARIERALGQDLAATVLISIAPALTSVPALLRSRPDRTEAAGAFLSFWPHSNLGDWGAREASPAAALTWSGGAPDDLTSLRAVAALTGTPPIAAVSMIALSPRNVKASEQGANRKDDGECGTGPVQKGEEPEHADQSRCDRGSMGRSVSLNGLELSGQVLKQGPKRRREWSRPALRELAIDWRNALHMIARREALLFS